MARLSHAAGSAGLTLLAAGATADVTSYALGYQYNARQTGPTTVELSNCAFVSAISAAPGDIAAAHTTNLASRRRFDMTEVGLGVFQGGEFFADPAALFDAYPLGTDRISISGGALGSRSGDETTPDPLHLPDHAPTFNAAQFPEYQSIDGLSDYTFRFNAFRSTGEREAVIFTIAAYPSGRGIFYGQTTAAAGRLTVPAGTLRLNRRFTVMLYFQSIVDDTGGFGGVPTSVSATRSTQLQVRTAGNCPPDYNGDGFLDFFDYDEFVTAFEAGDPDADYNGDNFLDFFDYNDFVAGFESGC